MNNNSNLFTNNIFNLMDKRANLYFAALLTSSLKKYVFYN
jgi:hypothetical protein